MTLPTVIGAPVAITVEGGDGQEGIAGTALPNPIVVKVIDSDSNPVAGQRVVFVLADESPGALITPDAVLTEADGTAEARWVLGGASGTQRVVARLVSEDAPGALEVRFTASATLPPADADRLELRSPPSTSATAGTSFDDQPVVQIRDADGDNIERDGVAITAAVASGSGTLGGTTTVLTDSRGRAEFTDLKIAGGTGAHVLIFAAGGYTSVTSAPIAVSEAPTPPAAPAPPAPPAPAPPAPPDLVARDDGYTIDEGSHRESVFEAPGVLANDQHGSGATVAVVNNASNGALTLRANGSFTYRPGPDYFGTDRFTYRIRQGNATSATATVTITIRPVNDSPNFRLRPNPDQRVSSGAGSQRVENFAEPIVTPSNGSESDQTAAFLVTTDNDALFSSGPAISWPDGTLTYTPSGRTGRARVSVRLKDNGGTANGGADTSGPEFFTIIVTSGD